MCRYSYVYYSYCDHAELTLLEHCSAAVAKAVRSSHVDRLQTRDGQQQDQCSQIDNEPEGGSGVSNCNTGAQRASHPANTLQHGVSEGTSQGQDVLGQEDTPVQDTSAQDASKYSNTQGDAWVQGNPLYENVLASPSTTLDLSPAARLAARFQQSEQDPFIEKPAPAKSSSSYADTLKTKSAETDDVTRSFRLPKRPRNNATEGAKQQERPCRGPLAITTNLPQQRRSSEPALDLASPQAFPALSSKSSITAPPSAVVGGQLGRSTSWARIARLTTSNESSPSSYSGPTAASDAGTVSTSVSASLISSPIDITFDPSNPSAERSPQCPQTPFDEPAKMAKDIIIPPIIKDTDTTPYSPRKTLPTEWLQDTSDGHAQSSSLHPKKSMGTLRTADGASHERATSPTKIKPFMFATARRAAEREAKVRISPTSPVKNSPGPPKPAKGKTAKLNPSTLSHSHASSISTTGTAFHTAQASPTHSISALSFATATEDHGEMASVPGSPSRIPRLALKVRRGRTQTGHTDQTIQLSEVLQVELTLSESTEKPESGNNATRQEIVELIEDNSDHSVTSEGAGTGEFTKSPDIFSSETAAQREESIGNNHETFEPQTQDYTEDDTSVLITSKVHDEAKSHQSDAETRTAVDKPRTSLSTEEPDYDAVIDQAESVQSKQQPAHDDDYRTKLQKTFIESNGFGLSATTDSTQDPAILYKVHGRKELFRSSPELMSLLRRRSATLPAKVALNGAPKVALNAEAKEFIPMANMAEASEQSYFNRAPLPPEMIYPEWRTKGVGYPAYPAKLSDSMQQIVRPPTERSQTWKGKGSAYIQKSPKKNWHRRFMSTDSESDGNTVTQASYKKLMRKNNDFRRREWNSTWYDGAWKSVNGAPPTFESFYADRAQRVPSDDRSIVTNPYHGRTSSKSSGSTTTGSGPEQHLGHGAIEPCGHWNVTMAGEFGNGVCHECSP